MTDYIKREDALNQFYRVYMFPRENGKSKYMEQIEDIHNKIHDLPAANVAEQKHGQWILTDYEDEQTYKCSECGELWTFIVGTPKDNGANYCPNCGARMVSDDV